MKSAIALTLAVAGNFILAYALCLTDTAAGGWLGVLSIFSFTMLAFIAGVVRYDYGQAR